MRGLHIEGLLHLSALTAAISAVYIGVDRIRQEPDRFRRELKAVQNRVRQSLLRLDVVANPIVAGPKLKRLFDTPSVHLLCYVAEMEIELGPTRRFYHFLHRQPYVPLLGYFRSRWDVVIVSACCLLSVVIFLLLVAVSTWHFQSISFFGLFSIAIASLKPVLFGVPAFSLMWIFFTAALSYRLQKLNAICTSFEQRVEQYVAETYADALVTILQWPPR